MNPEDYVSYPIALVLKKAGFDEPCEAFYAHTDGKMWLSVDGKEDWNSGVDYSAPTLWQAQKWLREKGIYAYCEPNRLKKWFARAIDLDKNEDLIFDGQIFDNFEEATEYAIAAALELIEKKGE